MKMIFISRLSETEVRNRLQSAIEPRQFLRRYSIFSDNNPKTRTFEGEMEGNEFNIQRIIQYRNSFLPKISGTVEGKIGETAIHVTMRLNASVFVFMAIWLGGVALAFFAILLSMIAEGKFNGAIFIPLGMFWLGFCFTYYGFRSETGKAKKELTDLLEAEIEPISKAV